MRKDKQEVYKLRREGRSYKEISDILHIPKSTLSEWLSGEVWSIDIRRQKESKDKILQRIRKMNDARLENSHKRSKIALDNALLVFQKNKHDPLFVAALMLYLGEGDKSIKNNSVRISNSEPVVLRIFILFLQKYMGISRDRIKIWLLLYPDLNEQICMNKWVEQTSLELHNFHKNQMIQGKHKTKRLIYGVGNIIIGSKYLKIEILELIRLLTNELSKADVV